MGLLFLILVVALIASFVAIEVVLFRRWRGGWRMAALLPGALFLIVIINIVVGTSLDRTSHNLWPMELIVWSAGGLAYIGLLVLIRKIAVLSLVVLVALSSFAAAQTKSQESTQFGIITVTTSSTLAPQAGNSYAPIKAIDGDNRTAWVEGAANDGVGEWIKVGYDSPMPISGIYFNNGYGKSTRSYTENGRVKEVLIETMNGSFKKVLADTNDEVQIRLPANMEGPKHPTKWVKLTIKSVYPGTKYKDTAISEFRPNLEEHNYSN